MRRYDQYFGRDGVKEVPTLFREWRRARSQNNCSRSACDHTIWNGKLLGNGRPVRFRGGRGLDRGAGLTENCRANLAGLVPGGYLVIVLSWRKDNMKAAFIGMVERFASVPACRFDHAVNCVLSGWREKWLTIPQ